MENIESKKKEVYPGVSALIKNGAGEFLIIQRSLADSMPGIWETPGGGLDFGEIPRDGVKREVKEEVGLDIEVKNLLDILTQVDEKNNIKRYILRIFFEANLINPEQSVELSNEHSEYRWVKPEDLKELYKSAFLEKLSSE